MKLLLVLLMITTALLFYMYGSNFFLKITGLKIAVNTRVVFLSDLHGKNLLIPPHKVASLINKLHPKLVLFGGDYVEKSVLELSKIEPLMREISAPKIFVLGNHELRLKEDDLQMLIAFLSSHGTVLRNSGVHLAGITVYGYESGNHKIVVDHNTIVVTHNPNNVMQIVGKPIIVLAGHFHGGQIMIPFLLKYLFARHFGSLFKQGFYSGDYQINDIRCYITTGLGYTWLPLRLRTRPEIVVLSKNVQPYD